MDTTFARPAHFSGAGCFGAGCGAWTARLNTAGSNSSTAGPVLVGSGPAGGAGGASCPNSAAGAAGSFGSGSALGRPDGGGTAGRIGFGAGIACGPLAAGGIGGTAAGASSGGT